MEKLLLLFFFGNKIIFKKIVHKILIFNLIIPSLILLIIKFYYMNYNIFNVVLFLEISLYFMLI